MTRSNNSFEGIFPSDDGCASVSLKKGLVLAKIFGASLMYDISTLCASVILAQSL